MKKRKWLHPIFLVIVLLAISCTAKSTPQSEIELTGPYDVAVLPLEDVPEPGPDVYRRSLSPTYRDYVSAEILAVLKDPRHIPIDHFIYYKVPYESNPRAPFWSEEHQEQYEERIDLSKATISHPDADRILERFSMDTHSAVVVYVRTIGETIEEDFSFIDGAPEIYTRGLYDPFYVQDPITDFTVRFRSISGTINEIVDRPWFPWSTLAVADASPGSDLVFPCKPQQLLGWGDTYVNPETGQEIDPTSYMPPKPWYTPTSAQIFSEEIREGWILCLAPDVPVEEIQLVEIKGYLPYDGSFSTKPGKILWMKPNYAQMGDWHLLQDMSVVAWNGDIFESEYEFGNLELEVVYQGDVWISMVTAVTYPGHNGLQRPITRVNIQIDFEGLDELLEIWDYVAIREWLPIQFCSDKTLSDCALGGRHNEPEGTTTTLDVFCAEDDLDCPETVTVEDYSTAYSINPFMPGSWVEVPVEFADELGFYGFLTESVEEDGTFEELVSSGQILAWHLDPQVLDIPILTTHSICEKENIECLPEDVEYVTYNVCDIPVIRCIDPETGEEKEGGPQPVTSPPSFDGPLPIIRLGESANGIRVLDGHVSKGPIIAPLNRDLSFQVPELKSHTGLEWPEDNMWMFINLEVQGTPGSLSVYQEIDDGIFIAEGGRLYYFYPNTGSYFAISSFGDGRTRRILSNAGLQLKPFDSVRLDKLILIVDNHDGGGPAYELPWSE